MSRFTHDSDEAHLCITCAGDTVALEASTPAGDTGLAETYIGFSLTPAQARDVARWLVLYAREADASHGPDPTKEPST